MPESTEPDVVRIVEHKTQLGMHDVVNDDGVLGEVIGVYPETGKISIHWDFIECRINRNHTFEDAARFKIVAKGIGLSGLGRGF